MQRRHRENRVECLDIGLINNMSDSALMSTERQLFDLLDAAAGRLCRQAAFLYDGGDAPFGMGARLRRVDITVASTIC